MVTDSIVSIDLQPFFLSSLLTNFLTHIIAIIYIFYNLDHTTIFFVLSIISISVIHPQFTKSFYHHILSDIHNSCFQHTFVKIIGTAFTVQIQVHIRQIIFIDDPCHVDLNALARFQRRNIITTIPIIFLLPTVFFCVLHSALFLTSYIF